MSTIIKKVHTILEKTVKNKQGKGREERRQRRDEEKRDLGEDRRREIMR